MQENVFIMVMQKWTRWWGKQEAAHFESEYLWYRKKLNPDLSYQSCYSEYCAISHQMAVSNISQMTLAKLQGFLWGYLKSIPKDSLAGSHETWSVVYLTLHFFFSSILFYFIFVNNYGYFNFKKELAIHLDSAENTQSKLPFPYSQPAVLDISTNSHGYRKSIVISHQCRMNHNRDFPGIFRLSLACALVSKYSKVEWKGWDLQGICRRFAALGSP